jgi:hypothetical protein
MEPTNRLAEIFADLGLAEVRISKEQLDKWGMTSTRFNQLVANTARVAMTVGEANSIRAWLQKNFKGKCAYLFTDELPQTQPGAQQRLPIQA